MRLSIKLSLGLIPLVLAGVVGYAIWAFHPFWLEEGTCQLRPVSYPVRKLNYRPYMAITNDCNEVPAGVPADARSFELDSATFHIQGMVWQKRGEYQLLLDQNQDGFDAGDKIVWGRQKTVDDYGGDQPWCFGPFQVPLKDSQRMSEDFYLLTNEDRFVSLYPARVYTGRLRIKQKIYRVYLNDTDLDGAMDSTFDPNAVGFTMPLCDAMVLSEAPNSCYITYQDEFPLGRLIKLNLDYYALDVSSDGCLTLQPMEPTCGQLVLSGVDRADLVLCSDAASGKRRVGREGTRLPVGHYATQWFDLELQDSQETAWSLHCYNTQGALATFEIKANETCTIEVGPPLQAVVETRTNGRTVYLTMTMKGRSGEIYSGIQTLRGRSKPPAFTLVNEAGEILERGRFEYG